MNQVEVEGKAEELWAFRCVECDERFEAVTSYIQREDGVAVIQQPCPKCGVAGKPISNVWSKEKRDKILGRKIKG